MHVTSPCRSSPSLPADHHHSVPIIARQQVKMSRSQAVKRLMLEHRALEADPPRDFVAQPLDDDLFVWHFTLRGPRDGGFSGGRYHGKIVFPLDYPMKPPNITFLNPNGRFEVGKKICLSITGYHPEHWHPAWGIQTAMIALIAFFPTNADGAIAGIDTSVEERARLAERSRRFRCPECGVDHATILDDAGDVADPTPNPTTDDDASNPLRIVLSMSPTRTTTIDQGQSSNALSPTNVNNNNLEQTSTEDDHVVDNDLDATNNTLQDVVGNVDGENNSTTTTNPDQQVPSNGDGQIAPQEPQSPTRGSKDKQPACLDDEDNGSKQQDTAEQSQNMKPVELDNNDSQQQQQRPATTTNTAFALTTGSRGAWLDSAHSKLARRVVHVRVLRARVALLETEATMYLRVMQLALFACVLSIVLYVQTA